MLSFGIIALFTLAEAALLGAVLFFFVRLKRSETLLSRLQANQEKLLARLQQNAELERELVATFAQRQAELRTLDQRLEDRAETLRRLLEQAEGIMRSPSFLRELILNGRKKGLSPQKIALSAGLSVDEVEVIIAQCEQERGHERGEKAALP
jgi:superfamily II RNA helicase